ncbi:thioesterase family protein [uncultured Roseibium sp.]|uniref:acyl-CoA thioesterase n=1 Tax=uncultured Roseibium sp. TaxID=1936171 RepID=UPI002593CF5F|nr:thioesterase family protein [uncultured Roseibium sp.]
MSSDAQLEAFAVHSTDKLRYCDSDPQGHVNNAVFSTFLETGRVDILYRGEGRIVDDGCAFVIARLEMDFRAELKWPGTVEIGTRIQKIGRTSITLEQAVFQNGVLAASALSVVVQMNQMERTPQPLSEMARERLGRLQSLPAAA